MRETSVTTLSPEQLEAHSNAVFTLGIMCLATLITHALLMAPLNPMEEDDLIVIWQFVGSFVLFLIWAAAFIVWGRNLGKFSTHKRNKSFILGVIAGNISVVYLLLTGPYAPAREYITYILWPVHVGLAVGALL